MYPRLFQIGPVAIPTYGAFLAFGLVAGLFLASACARRLALDPERMWNTGVLGILVTFLAAKAFLIAANFADFLAHPLWMLGLTTIRSAGVFAAALAAGIAAALAYAQTWARGAGGGRRRVADAAAPGLALGHAIVCVGAFAAGSGFGLPTRLPWGVVYTHPLAQRWSGTPLGIPLHPTQLYEAALEMLLFAGLLFRLHRRTEDGQVPGAQDGEMMGAWLLLFGLFHFFLDFLRGDPGRGSVGHVFTGSQLISMTAVLAGGLLLLRREARVSTDAVE